MDMRLGYRRRYAKKRRSRIIVFGVVAVLVSAIIGAGVQIYRASALSAALGIPFREAAAIVFTR
jgi:hypothetical protein